MGRHLDGVAIAEVPAGRVRRVGVIQEPGLIIFDEPTRGADVDAIVDITSV